MYNSALLQNTPFDLILTDYFMPVLDGLNATRIMREQGATIPIIMLTANNSVEDQNAAIAAGCSEIMLKPFRKMELLQMIEKWLTSAVKFNKLSCKSGSKINLHSWSMVSFSGKNFLKTQQELNLAKLALNFGV